MSGRLAAYIARRERWKVCPPTAFVHISVLLAWRLCKPFNTHLLKSWTVPRGLFSGPRFGSIDCLSAVSCLSLDVCKVRIPLPLVYRMQVSVPSDFKLYSPTVALRITYQHRRTIKLWLRTLLSSELCMKYDCASVRRDNPLFPPGCLAGSNSCLFLVVTRPSDRDDVWASSIQSSF